MEVRTAALKNRHLWNRISGHVHGSLHFHPYMFWISHFLCSVEKDTDEDTQSTGYQRRTNTGSSERINQADQDILDKLYMYGSVADDAFADNDDDYDPTEPDPEFDGEVYDEHSSVESLSDVEDDETAWLHRSLRLRQRDANESPIHSAPSIEQDSESDDTSDASEDEYSLEWRFRPLGPCEALLKSLVSSLLTLLFVPIVVNLVLLCAKSTTTSGYMFSMRWVYGITYRKSRQGYWTFNAPAAQISSGDFNAPALLIVLAKLIDSCFCSLTLGIGIFVNIACRCGCCGPPRTVGEACVGITTARRVCSY